MISSYLRGVMVVKKQVKVLKGGGEVVLPKEFRPVAGDLTDAGVRVKKIYSVLRKKHPDAGIALKYREPVELLVATVLSAQCTDVRVNIVTADLFKKYRGAGDYAGASQEELEEDIRSTGFYRNKAKNIIAACGEIVEKYNGRVPDNMEDLVRLPGVGRKTANVILGNAYGVPGVVTDTHVIRLSRLMGFSGHVDPVKLEFDLMKLIPKKNWTMFSHLLIFHGRRICIARKPDCENCPVQGYCCYGRLRLM